MAPPKKEEKKKRRNKRKSRTEVSSAEESSDSEASSTPQKSHESDVKDVESDVEMENTKIVVPEKRKEGPGVKRQFEEFYLRQATREFGEDLEKLRNASDWKGEQSLQMLVRGLKSGAMGFTGEEKRRVVGGGGEA